MKQFVARSYRLRDARFDVRLIYTGFLVLTLVGLLTLLAFQLAHIGPTPARIASYYCGGERGDEMVFPKTFRQLVEVTHFHSFIMGTMFLILAHLFVATGVRPSVRRVVIVLAFSGLLGDLVAPWLIRFVAEAFAYFELLSWLAMWIGLGALVFVPLWDMWSGRRIDEPPGD